MTALLVKNEGDGNNSVNTPDFYPRAIITDKKLSMFLQVIYIY